MKQEGKKAPPRQAFSIRPYKYDQAMKLAAKRSESHPKRISVSSNIKDSFFDRI